MKSKVSVIIAAYNEAKTIGPLVRRLLRWYRKPEVIVIANGCTDGTAQIAKAAGARVVRFRNKLGPDVGRAVGLSIAKGDVLVILDADILMNTAQLNPFVRAIERDGIDIALNRYPVSGTRKFQHPTAVAKHALNIFAGRPDLQASSLTAVPHALSRRALQQLGPLAFCVPPVAQARAICTGLQVKVVGQVQVGTLNRDRGQVHEGEMRRLIIGDCLEGIAVIVDDRGSRGGFTDLGRKRELLRQMPMQPISRAMTVAVVPSQGENSLQGVVDVLKLAAMDEIRVVLNGATAESAREARFRGAVKVDYFDDAVGHDIGRALGCMQVESERYFVTDADIPLQALDVVRFLEAVDDGVDIALNHLDALLTKARQVDPPSIVKRFLNLACDRPDLGVASMTAVPHAISRRALQDVGIEYFGVPPMAQVRAILAGLRVEAVHTVDVVKTNARRPHLHAATAGRPLEKLIVGDYAEAIAYLQAERGVRVSFPDTVRRRDIAERYILQHLPRFTMGTGARMNEMR